VCQFSTIAMVLNDDVIFVSLQLSLPEISAATVPRSWLHQSILNLVKPLRLSRGKDPTLFVLLDQLRFLILLGPHPLIRQHHLALGNTESIISFTCLEMNK
jgi:hypothetical protein